MTPTALRDLAARLETQTDDLGTLAVDVCVGLQWAPNNETAHNIEAGNVGWLHYETTNRSQNRCAEMPKSLTDLNAVIALVEREFTEFAWAIAKNGSLIAAVCHPKESLLSADDLMAATYEAPTPARALLAAYCFAKAELMENEG